MNQNPMIVWFRQDLRLEDNPALSEACKTGRPIIPLYILDEKHPGKWKMGGASFWWLCNSLRSLQKRLQACGSALFTFRGDPLKILPELIAKYDVGDVYFNRCYEPYALQRDRKLLELLPHVESFNGSLLFEPWEIKNLQKEPFKVFTPFWKKTAEVASSLERPLTAPEKILTKFIDAEPLDAWQPADPFSQLGAHWEVGEHAAHLKLKRFMAKGLEKYGVERDFPTSDASSGLSPHLHFGEISPRFIYHAAKKEPHCEKFLSEIGWREFCYYQLYHFPTLPDSPWRAEFAHFGWEENADWLQKWQQGQTGYPIVDAGMRELWHTGIMHNRVRMITASFLIKDLFIPWQQGQEWFWERLVDADLANNAANWQWVAGCGFDAAPFFRIFNPTLQGEKFDAQGVYIKQWVPELAKVPEKWIHQPWKAGIELDYPKPLVNHHEARDRALAEFKALRSAD